MTKDYLPDAGEIARLLRAAGNLTALAAFEKALADGDKITAIRIARQAGVVGTA